MNALIFLPVSKYHQNVTTMVSIAEVLPTMEVHVQKRKRTAKLHFYFLKPN
jgi:hypothetical protein